MKIEYSKEFERKLKKIMDYIEKELDLPKKKKEFNIIGNLHVTSHFDSFFGTRAYTIIHVPIPDRYIKIKKEK